MSVNVTPERFAEGMTYDEYVAYIGTPENLAREATGGATRRDYSDFFALAFRTAKLTDEQAEALTWIAAQPGGPAKVLVIAEDWSSDCRRDVPMLARLAEAGGLALRIFNRDGKRILWQRRPDPAAVPDANWDLMLEFMNAKEGGEWASLPAVGVYTKDFRELCRYLEYPSMYHKDPIRSHQQAARPGESREDAHARGMREFAALQASPFFDLWASAMVDEILSALHRRLLLGA
jgi:hypothetical protein